MIMSTIPIGFPESAVQSSSSELSDEFTAALAAGRWWAIMEVSSPISEEPEYGDLTSLRFPHSGFSESTLNTKESWRQKKTQSTPMPPRYLKGAPVPAFAEKRDHTSSLVFNNASEKAVSLHSGFSDAKLKTTEQQRKWRQKKPQGPPVLAGSEKVECGNSLKTTKQVRQQWRQNKPQGSPVLAGSEKAEYGNSLKTTKQVRQEWRQKKPQGPTVPGDSPHGHPVPTRSQQRGKIRIPEHLRQHLLQAANELGATVPARSPQGPPVPTKSLQIEPVPASKVQNLNTPEPLRQELQQKKPQASSHKGARVLNKTPERQWLKIPEPLRPELLQLSYRASSVKGELVPQKTQEKQRLKMPEPLKQELLQVSSRASTEKGAPVPQKIQERQRLKIPERLRQELLQKPQASPAEGKPMSSKSPKEAPLSDRNPVHTGGSQGSGVLSSSPLPTGCLKEAAVPTKTMKAEKRRLAEH
ncbi:uncharacterized protein LOC132107330 [Carassius carassius]|uniref:uncharacterized protein LOC132107330 n=1 Tax=Carassius carassius TaxID=217509 RepID=UPI0028694D7D|nr:uncharacterized protein LOC132107330 [Carassius carassius]